MRNALLTSDLLSNDADLIPKPRASLQRREDLADNTKKRSSTSMAKPQPPRYYVEILKGTTMWRERALKIALIVVGLFFTAALYPMIGGALHPAGSDTGDTMMMSLYFTLGVFLLISVRNPSAHRSLIAFAAWSCFAHAASMSTQGLRLPEQRTGFLIGSAALVVIGVVLIVLAPPKQLEERVSASAV